MASSPARVLLGLLYQVGQLVPPVPKPSAGQWAGTHSAMPDGQGDPNNFVTLYNTGADIVGRLMDGNYPKFYTVNLRIRAEGDELGWNKAAALEEAFKAVLNLVVNVLPSDPSPDVVTIRAIHLATQVVPIGTTERSRLQLFSMNVRFTTKGV